MTKDKNKAHFVESYLSQTSLCGLPVNDDLPVLFENHLVWLREPKSTRCLECSRLFLRLPAQESRIGSTILKAGWRPPFLSVGMMLGYHEPENEQEQHHPRGRWYLVTQAGDIENGPYIYRVAQLFTISGRSLTGQRTDLISRFTLAADFNPECFVDKDVWSLFEQFTSDGPL